MDAEAKARFDELDAKMDRVYSRIWESVAVAVNGDASHPNSEAALGPIIKQLGPQVAAMQAQITALQKQVAALQPNAALGGTATVQIALGPK